MLLELWAHDVRLAWRSLARAKAFSGEVSQMLSVEIWRFPRTHSKRNLLTK